jgi:hypothetical protein
MARLAMRRNLPVRQRNRDRHRTNHRPADTGHRRRLDDLIINDVDPVRGHAQRRGQRPRAVRRRHHGAFPGGSTASASLADATVAILTVPTIATHVVQSSSTTTCAGSTGTTTVDYLKIGATVVIAQPSQITSNTRITVGPRFTSLSTPSA